ncbi:hypothetical protein PV10_00769 [Exophiala mesophila]|uniref:NAD-dependent epimerase/dehydratase domain-containing protein n=1 Tax=Exophiala mesophila TaxID=212818 RepID=A0A0D1ZSU1_EXOME|nr:uncharacterized protein PV10_00769 [Exophiala mesophila]KIV96959.1 hypothetical protein PV10_00769 [Exophiala mesophila]
MPLTLVTGGNGFVGASIVSTLLAKGHSVILAVRNASSAEGLVSVHADWPRDRITIAVVPDFTVPGVFDEVFKSNPSIEYVVHVAAPLLDDPRNTDFVEHFEKPSVAGNISLLQSIKTFGLNVKAVSVTGSINSITLGDQDDVKARVFSNTEWLALGRDDAIKAQNSYISYCVGKKLAEKAVWDFIEREKPQFTVTNFQPPLIFGPMEQKVDSADKINFSTSQIQSILNSGKAEGGKVPATMFPGYIDVRDLADLQVLALTTPAAANRRFVVGHTMFFNDFADALRKVPEFASRIGENNDDRSVLTPARFGTQEVDDVFHYKYRSLEETAVDTAKSILAVEQK